MSVPQGTSGTLTMDAHGCNNTPDDADDFPLTRSFVNIAIGPTKDIQGQPVVRRDRLVRLEQARVLDGLRFTLDVQIPRSLRPGSYMFLVEEVPTVDSTPFTVMSRR